MSQQSDQDGENGAEPHAEAGAVALNAARRIADALSRPLAPGLYVVATPIGNLGDITLRALAVLATADVIYCEDTRHSRTLLSAFGIATRLRSYHDHNAEAERPRILEALAGGDRVALISDAGTPLVSDPGYKLVRATIEAGHPVHGVPGASALLTALVASGLPSDRFLFAGFLPSRQSARREAIAGLAGVEATLVLFEAPGRLAESLTDLAQGLGPREAVVARELTKLYEECLRGTLETLASEVAQRDVKGEIVVVIAPPSPAAMDVSDAEIASELTVALQAHTLRDAVRAVADKLVVPRKRVYDIGLGLKQDQP